MIKDIAPWKLNDEYVINLITPERFDTLPDGAVLFSINGRQVVKGTDRIDMDTRAGFIAYGFREKA